MHVIYTCIHHFLCEKIKVQMKKNYSYILKTLSSTSSVEVMITIAYDDLDKLIEYSNTMNIQTYLLQMIKDNITDDRNWNIDKIEDIKELAKNILIIYDLYSNKGKLKLPETIEDLHYLLDAIDFILGRYSSNFDIFVDLQMYLINALPVSDKTSRLIYSHIIRRT